MSTAGAACRDGQNQAFGTDDLHGQVRCDGCRIARAGSPELAADAHVARGRKPFDGHAAAPDEPLDRRRLVHLVRVAQQRIERHVLGDPGRQEPGGDPGGRIERRVDPPADGQGEDPPGHLQRGVAPERRAAWGHRTHIISWLSHGQGCSGRGVDEDRVQGIAASDHRGRAGVAAPRPRDHEPGCRRTGDSGADRGCLARQGGAHRIDDRAEHGCLRGHRRGAPRPDRAHRPASGSHRRAGLPGGVRRHPSLLEVGGAAHHGLGALSPASSISASGRRAA